MTRDEKAATKIVRITLENPVKSKSRDTGSELAGPYLGSSNKHVPSGHDHHRNCWRSETEHAIKTAIVAIENISLFIDSLRNNFIERYVLATVSVSLAIGFISHLQE